ncbi:lysozyme family protein [Larsenimonas rhizosphaerae]|uniref:Uncharacterized protein n=1 Tax=Larsenimonas rhizosphaerae TaxID=2944682 RepID=A0AA42CVB9_9GAMM|nr:hypothetical protein [Larsenimonas rhizosphaerae]MCX2525487.1 hypothetical protein [Larsenimonas rhizosphaerae]
MTLHQARSTEECTELLKGDLGQAFDAISASLAPDINQTLPQRAGQRWHRSPSTSVTGVFQQSTLLKRLNAEQTRAAERELCLIGVER